MIGRGRWAWATLVFAVGYLALRLYWATGGRWEYSACDQRRETPDMSSGCGADGVATLPFWSGWGAVALSALLGGVAVLATRSAAVDRGRKSAGPTAGTATTGRAGTSGGRVAAAGAWAACVALVLAAFPMHLVFQIPAGLAGHPSDWRNLAHRSLLLVGGFLFGAAAATGHPHRCGHPREDGPVPRPAPIWLRRWAYAATALPVLGWAVPHGLWFLGVPVGISGATLDEVRGDLVEGHLATSMALVLAPTLGGLLALGLAQGWGQVFPSWMPWLGGRRVPRLVALVPAGTVAASLTAYGLLSMGFMVGDLSSGKARWSGLLTGWAVTGTLLVFFAWGVTLGVATYGYHRLTRVHCPRCATGPARALTPGRAVVGER